MVGLLTLSLLVLNLIASSNLTLFAEMTLSIIWTSLVLTCTVLGTIHFLKNGTLLHFWW